MKSTSLENIVRQYVHLNSPNSKGWETCIHVGGCDRGHKGPRAAFLFDGPVVAFHCFNCSVKTKYDPSEHKLIPPNMKKVLADFNIPDDELKHVEFSNLGNDTVATEKIDKPTNIEPDDIGLPDNFYLLSDAGDDDKWAEVAREYLSNERGVDPTSYPFMLSTPTSDVRLKKWNGRIILPIFKDKKVIFYQGRDMSDTQVKKYESPSVPKDKVMYGFDRLFESPRESPLYVVEGWFDAHAINGVAILGNEITNVQMAWLNRSPRKKVYIPDRFGDGHRAGEQAINAGWSISTPDIGNCKDISEAVHKYGVLYIMKSLAENTADGFTAKAKLGIYCEQSSSKSKSSKTPKDKRR